MSATLIPTLPDVAVKLREELKKKRFVLLYAHNGTGKTRLSVEFKNIGKNGDERDTLYFNAFTEDLFSWDNDLETDLNRVLKINNKSRFFSGIDDLEMDNRIRPLLLRYADFDFTIDTTKWEVSFSRETPNPNYDENAPLNDRGENPTGERTLTRKDIKISRGEENIFVWCFFMALVQIVVDADDGNPYAWVKYVYIDDPISSLDEHNATKVAHDLTDLLFDSGDSLRVAISTHHILFYNVIANQLRNKATKYFLSKGAEPETYLLENWGNVPPFHHLSTLLELCKTRDSGEPNSHHFGMLRRVFEQTAAFFGNESWTDCLRPREGESEKAFQKRVLDLNSHGDYVIFESPKIDEKTQSEFKVILEEFRRGFHFNTKFFPPEPAPAAAPGANPSPNKV